MKAAVFTAPHSGDAAFVTMHDVPVPTVRAGYSLLRVLACGVCRTDLHIVEGDLPPVRPVLVPGHQVVGEIVHGGTPALPEGSRAGVSWLGGVDGTCWYCLHGKENLCAQPVFTGYSVDGGYAEYVLVRTDFLVPLPGPMLPVDAAPLLCAGIIGFRSLRVAGVEPGERVGLFGFGSSASLAIQVLHSWNCEVYVATRGQAHRDEATAHHAQWVGKENDAPPVTLDRAITFAPSGKVVVQALASLRKGGVVAVNAIHLDQMPAFNYDTLLWGERQIRSVANMTRQDASDFLALAHQIKIRTRTRTFKLEEADAALHLLKTGEDGRSFVLVP